MKTEQRTPTRQTAGPVSHASQPFMAARMKARRRTPVLLEGCMVCAVLLGLSSARADYRATILADHPVAYYQIEETNASPTVADSSGNGFTGYISYVTQSDGTTVFPELGRPGLATNSAAFAKSTGIGQGNIDVPVNATINPTTDGTHGAPFSAELWAMANTQPGNYLVPLADSSDFLQPPPYDNSAGWNFYQTPGPASAWSVSIRPNPGFVGNGPAVALGEWAHLVLTYDGTNATFYVNGTAAGTYAVPLFLANNGSSDMIIGAGPATAFDPFDGNVDEVAVYTNALTAEQVLAHYMVGTNSIRAVPTPPSFIVQPASTNTYSGVPVTFTSQATGTTPLSYQWVRGGSGPIPGATNSSYTLTPSYPQDDMATFSVTVTNVAGGTNSLAATLTVQTNLNMVYNPFSITRRVGSYAAFRVVADGAQPITYQWHCISNSVDQPISGATSDTLWLKDVRSGANGTLYYAHVAGPFGNADSAQASLSVVARSATAPVSGYSKVVMADQPVGYWRLDETNGSVALDTAGSFDGVYASSGGDLTFGAASGIPHEIDTAIHVTNTAKVTIPYALELNPVTGPWSVEFWLQPDALDPNDYRTPISSEDNQNASANLTGWNIYQHVAGVWTWNIFNGSSLGGFNSEFTDNPIVPGAWYHMVLTDDGTNMNWYSNNRLVLALNAKDVNFVPNGINGDPAVAGGPLTLAVRSDGAFGGWPGTLDDLAVYNYVLAPEQIQNHFLNTTRVTIEQAGASVIIRWPAGDLQSATQVNGTYSDVPGATSPYTNSMVGTPGFFRVKLQ